MRGCGVVATRQLPKLEMRVRFPSAAFRQMRLDAAQNNSTSTDTPGILSHAASVTATQVIGQEHFLLSKIGPHRIDLVTARFLPVSTEVVIATVDGAEQSCPAPRQCPI